jgi:hypothetical protein
MHDINKTRTILPTYACEYVTHLNLDQELAFIPVKACLIVVMNGFRGTSSSRFCSSFNVRCRTEGVHESAESNRDVQSIEDIAEMVWAGNEKK